jgi:hypothetical protein
MRMPYVAFVLALSAFAQAGCKCCHHGESVPLPPPPPCEIRVSPPAVAPSTPPLPPAVGMLPSSDPDRDRAEPLPTRAVSLTSWQR